MTWNDFIKKIDHCIEIKDKVNVETYTKNGVIYQRSIIPLQDFIKSVESVYIFGSVGVGKTYQMLRLAKLKYFTYIKWNDLVDINLKKMRGEDFSDKDQYLSDYKTNNVYIIDDFLTSKLSQTQLELMFKIIDYRTENKLPTFITGNYSPKEISLLLNKVENVDYAMANRITSRLRLFKVIKVVGADRRKTNEI